MNGSLLPGVLDADICTNGSGWMNKAKEFLLFD